MPALVAVLTALLSYPDVMGCGPVAAAPSMAQAVRNCMATGRDAMQVLGRSSW